MKEELPATTSFFSFYVRLIVHSDAFSFLFFLFMLELKLLHINFAACYGDNRWLYTIPLIPTNE